MAGSAPAKKAAPARKAAPRKAAPAKPADQIVPGVPASAAAAAEPEEEFDGFDLDNLQKNEVLPDVTDQPFRFLLAGHWFLMIDPRDVDWKRVLDGINNPILFMRLALVDPAEADRFVNTDLPGWKLSALFDRWQKHYGVDSIVDLNKMLSGREQQQ